MIEIYRQKCQLLGDLVNQQRKIGLLIQITLEEIKQLEIENEKINENQSTQDGTVNQDR